MPDKKKEFLDEIQNLKSLDFKDVSDTKGKILKEQENTTLEQTGKEYLKKNTAFLNNHAG